MYVYGNCFFMSIVETVWGSVESFVCVAAVVKDSIFYASEC